MTEIVLETSGLTKYFKDKCVVDHLDLKIPKGCVCGFLGRNGAGKTTTIRMLIGLLKPTTGSGSLLGCDCQELTPTIRQRVGYVTEGQRLYKWMKIGELEKFRNTIRKYIVTFDKSIPAEINIDGLLHYRSDKNVVEITLTNTDEKTVQKWAAAAGAKDCRLVALNLEDQFIEFTSPAKKGKLFDWEYN